MRPTKSSHCFQVKGQQIKFSSNFDSGNLRTVTQVGYFQFLIQSSHDTYQIPASTKSFFHFKVQNYPLNTQIKIIIKNLSLLYCIKQERRKLYRPCYSHNGYDYERMTSEQSSIITKQNELKLQINFLMVKSSVYFAFSLPYSYQRYLNMVRDLPESNEQLYINKQVLCYSRNLHLVYMITITSFNGRTDGYDQIGSSTNGVILPQKHLNQSRIYFDKPVILLSARVHPGESPSSWAIQGIIKFLLSDNQQAKILRNKFLIVIVPMLNPDGVIEGLYRLDPDCLNLNRYYLISDNRQPSIYSMKHLIKHYYATKRLLFYFDFHGHPSYKGSFLYGNAIDDIAFQAQTQLFGRIMSIYCDTFQQKYCIFDRQQMSSKDKYDMYTKQGCARVYAFKTANILHSYTVQMGFHGCTNFPENSQKLPQNFCYLQQDYYKEGVSVLKSVLQACSLTKSLKIDKNQLRKQIAQQILIRQQRFRKQDRHIFQKKKNVNQTIQNQYWKPVKKKFFCSRSLIQNVKNIKSSKKKVQHRTTFISSSFIKNGEQNQRQSRFDTYIKPFMSQLQGKEKIHTQSAQFNQNSLLNKTYHKIKRLQNDQMISSSKKHSDSYIYTYSSFSKKKQEFSNRTKIQVERKISTFDKTVQKKKKSQIKIFSSRKIFQQQPTRKKANFKFQNLQQFSFNDQNMRKHNVGYHSQTKNSFCIASTQKMTSRIQQIRYDIFRPESVKNPQHHRKVGKTYRKDLHIYS